MGSRFTSGRQSMQQLEDSEDRMKSLKDEMKTYIERIVLINNEKINEQKNVSEMMVEGRANAFTVDVERKYQEMFRLFSEEVKINERESRLKLKEWGDEVKDDILKVKGDLQRRERQLDERQEDQKKWVEH